MFCSLVHVGRCYELCVCAYCHVCSRLLILLCKTLINLVHFVGGIVSVSE